VFSENEGLHANQLNCTCFKDNILFIAGDKGINTALPSSLENPCTKLTFALQILKLQADRNLLTQ
jgi:hypothetical protein